jgi:hypothetical protein
MGTINIQTGEVEPVETYVVDFSNNPLTGKTDLFLRVRRKSDNFYLDWNDMTFKSSGWTLRDRSLVEIDNTLSPGMYEIPGGFDTSAIVNPVVDDTYIMIPLQTPGTDAVVPDPTDIKVGRWLDDVQTVLVSLVSADLVAAAGSSAVQIRTGATQADGYYDGMAVVVVNSSGTAMRLVESYLNANGEFTLDSALPFTPAVNDRVLVLNTVGVGADLQAQVDKIDKVATLGPAAAGTGSLLDRLANKDASKTYNQSTDSLEAQRDRVG